MDGKIIASPHNIVIEDRKSVTVTGVTDVDSFDEQTVVLMTDVGELVIHGYGMHISRIDVEAGDLALEGEIYGVTYSDRQQNSNNGLFSKLFK